MNAKPANYKEDRNSSPTKGKWNKDQMGERSRQIGMPSVPWKDLTYCVRILERMESEHGEDGNSPYMIKKVDMAGLTLHSAVLTKRYANRACGTRFPIVACATVGTNRRVLDWIK